MTALDGAVISEASPSRVSRSRVLPVRIWLFAIASAIFAMVIVGGATRLTGSGLSITEWQPIMGVIPPLNHEGWQDAFQKYQQIPEYRLVNEGMSLAQFKAIYWWEWAHRLLGRSIGVIFLLPFVFFLWRGSIPKPFIPRVALLFILGGAQGALGWFMVKSGLVSRVDVSQYRLAAHLALAVAIAGFAVWLAFSLGDTPSGRDGGARSRGVPLLHAGALCLGGLIYAQIILGAFVAGLKAGYASDTWPLMNGAIVPPGIDALHPWWLNLFENPLAAQFAHRMLAYGIAIAACVYGLAVFHGEDARRLRPAVSALCVAIFAQIALGVATIILHVPINLALAHQANAILVLALALWLNHRVSRGKPSIGLGA